MADKDVLTQEEIDALLSGVDKAELSEGDDPVAADVQPYDLTKQNRPVGGRLPTVELVAERFARRLRLSLPRSLKIPLEIGQAGVQVMKFGDYLDLLQIPSCIKVLKAEPFAGHCLATLDADLVHKIVDCFFGGMGLVQGMQHRDFSPTEHRVINRIVSLLLEELTVAWEELVPLKFEVVGNEINPAFINHIAGNDMVLVISHRIQLEEDGGELQWVYPYSSLADFKQILDAATQIDDSQAVDAWQQAMLGAIMDTEVALNCCIGQSQLRVRDIAGLQAGQVLDIDMAEQHQVGVSDVALFVASLGDSRGRFALEFERFGQL
ncbi:MAG: flagellar motor switch protein FliM [Pseudomonadota bacterium]